VYEGIFQFDAMVSILLSLLFERELRVSTAIDSVSELLRLPPTHIIHLCYYYMLLCKKISTYLEREIIEFIIKRGIPALIKFQKIKPYIKLYTQKHHQVLLQG